MLARTSKLRKEAPLGHNGLTAFFVVAGTLVLMNLRIQRQYTQAVRNTMTGAARSWWIPKWLHPSVLTISGVLLCFAAAVITQFKHASHPWMGCAAGLFVIGAMLDVLDGPVARQNNKVTAFGAFLDSNTDRIGEVVLLAVLGYLTVQNGNAYAGEVVVLSSAGFYAVSYARSTMKAAGLVPSNGRLDNGMAQRAERCTAVVGAMVWMALGWSFTPWVYLIAGLSWFTVGQRVIGAYRAWRPQREHPSSEYWASWPESREM